MLKTYSLQELNELRLSKGELFSQFKETFDYALPQTWLDNVSAWCKANSPIITYDLIRSTTVWSYGKGDLLGGPVTVCNEVHDALVAFYNQLNRKG